MKNALMAVAITALMGGLVIAPVTQQSAEAQVYGGLKSTSAPAGSELLTLVGHGGGGGHFGGGHMGGGHVGGGHMGGNHWAGGGGRHWGGGGHPHVAYGGGGSWHGHHGNSHGHNNNWHGHANNWAYYNRHHRYYRYGRYYPYWYRGLRLRLRLRQLRVAPPSGADHQQPLLVEPLLLLRLLTG